MSIYGNHLCHITCFKISFVTFEANYFRRHVNTIITVIKPLIYFEITQFSISLNCLFGCVTTISCTQLVLYNFCYTLYTRIETVYNTSKIFDMKWKIVSLHSINSTFGWIYVDYMDLRLTVKHYNVRCCYQLQLKTSD